APEWPAAHFALAETLEAVGRAEDARCHFVAYLKFADSDEMGAEIRLALLGAAPVPLVLPEAYVRALFDQYASKFDESLLAGLDYRVPYRLRDAVERIRPSKGAGERILDLGCGTGLAGEAFRARASWLEGVDLSPGMAAEAERKTIYDNLRVAEATADLAGRADTYDLIVAADVLVYIGDLMPIFKTAAQALHPDGLFAFSVQRTDGADYRLGAECRYSHRESYLRRVASEAGLETLEIADAVLRTEKGADVPGLIGVCRRPPALLSILEPSEPAALRLPAY
ncbi:MAG: methyltransferase domain-containing protein, partial [Proteobacteria bacterium]|nr:methyltransferase domain-containing protein [Pseudomonadota bacterium]